ncbi:hypothetical protein [Halobaculum sp. EA56]|uniref:hypothetical protein n=1 Tax=Halobaculum sp. EA56 TaxID=3421648 RepID=UPI003EBC6B72
MPSTETSASTARVNRLAVGGLVAGVVWTLLGAVSLFTAITGSVLDVVLVVGNVLLVLPVLGLYLLYRDEFPRLGAASVGAFLAGTLANVVGTAGVVVGVESLSVLAFPVGVVGELLGFLGFAAMTARSDRLPRWTGSLLVLTFPGAAAVGALAGTASSFGDYPGAVVVGALVLVVASVLYGRTK